MRVVIAEDGVLLREGLGRLLAEEGHEVVGSVEDALGLVEAVERERPDVFVDVRMPPTFTDEGLRAAIEIRERWPGTPVLVLSQYVEERYATELLSDESGAVGYLLKQRVADVRATSLTRSSAWPAAAPPSTRRWSRSSWPERAATRRTSSRRASARSSGLWPRVCRTPGSPGAWS